MLQIPPGRVLLGEGGGGEGEGASSAGGQKGGLTIDSIATGDSSQAQSNKGNRISLIQI